MPRVMITLAMKIAAYWTLCCLPLSAVVAQDQDPSELTVDRYARKEAAQWVKTDLSNKKKALALFKKVKDEKSASKAAAAVLKLYSLENEGKVTALGEVGPASDPTGPAFEEAKKKAEKQREKLLEALEKENERISSLNIESDDLARAMEAALK